MKIITHIWPDRDENNTDTYEAIYCFQDFKKKYHFHINSKTTLLSNGNVSKIIDSRNLLALSGIEALEKQGNVSKLKVPIYIDSEQTLLIREQNVYIGLYNVIEKNFSLRERIGRLSLLIEKK